jgi:Tol biopolymer transport system component
MALLPGTRLGIYEITELIGAGGMGEVYRARDSRLHRDVATKILPPDLTPTAEQLARFDREAQSLAALNHANIAHLYGIEETAAPNGTTLRALIMEFVDGEDLAQRLRRGPIAIDEALRIAVQIALGLEAAHENGIIHRDLKPANVKVRADGVVKILDFGLAKALDPAVHSPASNDGSPTITSPMHMTRHGVVLGTAAYMAPEQARGHVVDKRADVWAFGALLYEMLTGTRAFGGDTISDTVAAVLKSEPDWTLVSSSTPYLARRVLMNCLRKDPRERLADVHDARLDLADALLHGDASAPAQQRRFAWQLASLAGVAIVVIAAAIGVAWTGAWSSRAPMTGVIRSSLLVADQPAVNNSPAIAPDGGSIVYSAAQQRGLWLRRLDETAWRFLAGTEGANRPFWSPDSSQIAYFARGKLRSIHIASGVVKDIVAAPSFFGGAWSSADVIIFGLQGNGGLQRVAIGDGVATQLTSIDSSEIAHRWPFFFPDGQHFGYVSQRDDGYQLMVGSLNGDAPAAVTAVESSVAFAPPDIVLIARGGNLFAHRFDIRGRNLSAAGVKIAEEVGVSPTRETWVSVSATGALIYLPPRSLPRGRLAWVDRAGRVEYLPLPEGPYGEPALSPDGSKVALSVREVSGAELWLYDIDRITFGRRTFTRASTFAMWSPDGRRLSYTHYIAQSGPLMQMAADGSGEPEMLVSSVDQPGVKVVTSWLADGTLIFQRNADLMIRRPDGSIQPLLATAAAEGEGRLSPDNHWLAYTSDETGSGNVFVQSYPLGRGKWQISSAGGAQPMWAPDGRELYFINDNRMMVVAFELAPTFKPGVPRVLFEIPLPARDPGEPSRYGVSPDGKRFLVLTTDRPTASPPVPFHLVSNWRSLLEQPRQ